MLFRSPAALVAVVMQCLEKSADERYPRGDALADALLAYLATCEEADKPRRLAFVARRPVPSERA